MMGDTPRGAWDPQLCDPSGGRDKSRIGAAYAKQPMQRSGGRTMVIDKGLGWHAYADMIETTGPYIDMIKLGFGTSPLYPAELLLRKIEHAKQHGITIMPGGTLLETAVYHDLAASFFETICTLGFDGIEVSDGTIDLPRDRRTALIREGVARGLLVCTEYGKKDAGSVIDAYELAVTAEADWNAGAELVTIEARETGTVGMFDSNGALDREAFDCMMRLLPGPNRIMWEAPLKEQQVFLIRSIGPDVHLGNIPPADVMALETMRRGLRNDTFAMRKDKAKAGDGTEAEAAEMEDTEESDYYMI